MTQQVTVSVNNDYSAVLKDFKGNTIYPITRVDYVEGIGYDNVNILADKDSKLIKYLSYVNDDDVLYITEEDSTKPIATTIDVYQIYDNLMQKYADGYISTDGKLHLIGETTIGYTANSNKNYKVISTSYYSLVKESASDGYIGNYKLYKDGNSVGFPTIKVPNGNKISEVLLKQCTINDNPIVGLKINDYYLDIKTYKFDGSDKPIEEHYYTNLSQLTDIYTAGDGIIIDNKKIIANTGIGIKIYDEKITFDSDDVIANGSDGTTIGTSGTIPIANNKNMVLSSNKDSNGKVSWVNGITYTELD